MISLFFMASPTQTYNDSVVKLRTVGFIFVFSTNTIFNLNTYFAMSSGWTSDFLYCQTSVMDPIDEFPLNCNVKNSYIDC